MSMQRERAYRLHVEYGMDLKKVAEILGVNVRSMYRWSKLDRWKELRNTKTLATNKLVTQYYEQCDGILKGAIIENRPVNDKESAAIGRLTTCILNMQNKSTRAYHFMHAYRQLGEYLLRTGRVEMAKTYLEVHTEFLNELLGAEGEPLLVSK